MKPSYHINCFYSILIIPILCLFSLNSHSQTNPYTPKINIPTSPEAALFGRFGDVPVGYHTGTADISIPLYTIEEGDIKIPVALRYHSSGIKVADEATWVGLGWDLFPGGAVIQEVRGVNDQSDNLINQSGYTVFMNRLDNTPSLGNPKVMKQSGKAYYNWDCFTECYNGNCGLPNIWIGDGTDPESAGLIHALQEGHGDPDIYHFNFGNYSGSFYLNPVSGNVVILNKKDNIIFSLDAGICTAITPDGTKYTFGAVEYAYGNNASYQYPDKVGRTFKLSLIEFRNGRTVSFGYTSALGSRLSFNQSAIVHTYDSFAEPNYNFPLPNSVPLAESDLKILNRITTSDAIITFNLENREDINLSVNRTDTQKRLKSVDIKSIETGLKVKSFEFGYGYFNYNSTGTPTGSIFYTNLINATTIPVLGKRLKLNTLKEIGYDTSENAVTTKPAYKFEYDESGTMPIKVSNAVDFYGYYNGANNSSLLPDLDYFAYPTMYIVDNNNIPFSYSSYAKANRYANNDVAGLYMLKKITYPTGGSTKFEYEPNSFTNKFIPNQQQASLALKTGVISPTGFNNSPLVQTGNFTINRSVTINFRNSVSNGWTPYSPPGSPGYSPNPNMPAYQASALQGCKIIFTKTRVMPNGQYVFTTIKEWNMSSIANVDIETNHTVYWNESMFLQYEPNTFYSIEVTNNVAYTSADTYHIAGIKADYSFFDNTGVDTSISRQCGMRIKSIKNYSEDGILNGEKRYLYYDGKLLTHFEPLQRKRAYSFRCTGSNNSGFCNCSTFIQTPEFTEFSITSDVINDSGTLIGYGRVEEVELSNINNRENIGKKAFSFFNFENLSSNGFYDMPNAKTGMPLQDQIYDSSGKLLSKTLYSYQNLNGYVNCFYGVKIVHNFRGNIDPMEFATGNLGGRSKFSYYASPLLAEWHMLSQKQTTEYFNDNEVVNTENYTYNTNGIISSATASNSKGETLTTNYYYPTDHLIDTTIDNVMIQGNQINTPVIIKQYNGMELLSQTKTVYDTSGSLPSMIYAAKGNDPLELKVSILSYNTKGNPREYQLANGVKVAILWNQTGTLPRAKVENATYLEASSTTPLSNLTNAMATTYTYRPLVGVTSITDPRGDVTYYEYDAYGRLINVKDKDNYILSKNEYHYIPQN